MDEAVFPAFASKRTPGASLLPTHFAVVFGRTADDDPVLVELVCPTIDNSPKGSAVSVTEYGDEAAPGEFGPLEFESAPPHTVRRRELTRVTTRLTNRDIFDPLLPTRDDGTPLGLIERLWARNFATFDASLDTSAQAQMTGSRDWAATLIRGATHPASLPDALGPVARLLSDRTVEWSQLMRQRLRPGEGRYQSPNCINLLFYQRPRPTPIGWDQARPPLAPLRDLYAIQSVRADVFRPTLVGSGWLGFLDFLDPPPPPLSPASGPVPMDLRFSREPMYTADVLPNAMHRCCRYRISEADDWTPKGATWTCRQGQAVTMPEASSVGAPAPLGAASTSGQPRET